MRVVRKQPSLKLKQQSLGWWEGTLDHTSCQFDYSYFCIHNYIWIWIFVCVRLCIVMYFQCNNFNFNFFLFLDFGLFFKFLVWKETHIKVLLGRIFSVFFFFAWINLDIVPWIFYFSRMMWVGCQIHDHMQQYQHFIFQFNKLGNNLKQKLDLYLKEIWNA